MVIVRAGYPPAGKSNDLSEIPGVGFPTPKATVTRPPPKQWPVDGLTGTVDGFTVEPWQTSKQPWLRRSGTACSS